MGNICSSCCERDKEKYKTVEGEDGVEFHDDMGSEFRNLQFELDMKSSVFEGALIPRKFSRNRKYENRFMWVNLDSKTIHMSQHNSKERRHKEASLADVSSILKGAPTIAEGLIGKSSCCLTINFQKDSGIDLCFATEAECDLWYTVLSRIIKLMKNPSTITSP